MKADGLLGCRLHPLFALRRLKSLGQPLKGDLALLSSCLSVLSIENPTPPPPLILFLGNTGPQFVKVPFIYVHSIISGLS